MRKLNLFQGLHKCLDPYKYYLAYIYAEWIRSWLEFLVIWSTLILVQSSELYNSKWTPVNKTRVSMGQETW